jgi:hypothetical protein
LISALAYSNLNGQSAPQDILGCDLISRSGKTTMKIDNYGSPKFRKSTRFVLIMLIAAICIWRSESQLYYFFRYYQSFGDTPILIFVTSTVIAVLELFAAYQVFYKPFLAFMGLLAVLGIHLIIVPIFDLMAVASGTIHGSNYWLHFMITSIEHIVLALMAFVLWRFSRGIE